MSTVSEIESAVQKLSPGDLRASRDWFLGFEAAAWESNLRTMPPPVASTRWRTKQRDSDHFPN